MSLSYSTNDAGDTIETHSDGVVLNFSYWECICTGGLQAWIHHISKPMCTGCNYTIDDGASARNADVQHMIMELVE